MPAEIQGHRFGVTGRKPVSLLLCLRQIYFKTAIRLERNIGRTERIAVLVIGYQETILIVNSDIPPSGGRRRALYHVVAIAQQRVAIIVSVGIQINHLRFIQCHESVFGDPRPNIGVCPGAANGKIG